MPGVAVGRHGHDKTPRGGGGFFFFFFFFPFNEMELPNRRSLQQFLFCERSINLTLSLCAAEKGSLEACC